MLVPIMNKSYVNLIHIDTFKIFGESKNKRLPFDK